MKNEIVTLKSVTMMAASKLHVKKMGVMVLILVVMSLLRVIQSDELVFAHSVNIIIYFMNFNDFEFDHTKKNSTKFLNGIQLCRHGDRTASNSYQNDPQKSENDCDNAYGRLTNVNCSIDACLSSSV